METRKTIVGGLVVALLVGGGVPMAHAVEPAAKPKPARAMDTAASQSMFAEGVIADVDVTATAPSVKLSKADGQAVTFTIDPRTTGVWDNGSYATYHQLRKGQHAKVQYMLRDGKDVAQSIQVTQAPKSVAASASTAKPAAATSSTASHK